MSKYILTPLQEDTLIEVIQIGAGKGADSLNRLLNTHISLQIPRIQLQDSDAILKSLEKLGSNSLATVNLKFDGSFNGMTVLIFPEESAAVLVKTMLGDRIETDHLPEMKIPVLQEIGNILINSVMGSLSNMLDKTLEYQVPEYQEKSANDLAMLQEENEVLLVETSFSLPALEVAGNMLLAFQVSSYQDLMESINLLSQKKL